MIHNFKAGERIKNYTELCSRLGLDKPKTGDARKKHLMDLKETIDYEMDGRAFVINKVLQNEIIEKRNKRNTSSHITSMKILLLNILKDNDDDTQYYSTTGLAIALQLIGKQYTELFSGIKRKNIAQDTGLSIASVDDFFNSTTPAYKRAIKTILKQLERDGAIFFNTATMITKEDIDGLKYTEPATKNELKELLKIQKQCMKHFGKTSQDIYNKNLSDKYYQLLKEQLKEHMGVIYHYKAYEIQGLDESLNDEYNYLLKEEDINPIEIEDMKFFLSKRIYKEWHQSSMKRFSNRKLNALKHNSFGEAKEIYKPRISDSYEQEMELLYNIFVRNKNLSVNAN